MSPGVKASVGRSKKMTAGPFKLDSFDADLMLHAAVLALCVFPNNDRVDVFEWEKKKRREKEYGNKTSARLNFLGST